MISRALWPRLRRLAGGVLLLVCLGAAAAAEEARVALAIGNGAYRNAPALGNPGHDADAMAAALRGIGFAVTVQHDLTLAAMRAAVREFGGRARGAKVAVLFYAGHGLQVGRRDRAENFLVPVDARLADARDVEDETLALGRVLEWLDGAESRIVILDACRDNPLAQRMANGGGSRSVSRGLAPVEGAAGGTLVVFATEPGTTAADGSGGNSPFTAALLEQLPAPGLEVRAMLTRVRQKVMAATGGRQTPWSNDGLLQEVFLAARPAEVVAVQPHAAAIVPPPAVSADVLDLAFWQSIQASRNVGDYEAYLRRFPGGNFADLARNRIAELRRPAPVPPPSPPPAAPVGVLAAPSAVPRPSSGTPRAVGRSLRDCPECPELVVIPAGRFVMGTPVSEPGREGDEDPPHDVVFSAPLAVGKYAVTFAEWDRCVAAGGCGGYRPDDRGWGRDRRPVINVSWHDAQQYVGWLSQRTAKGYRLLTEAEWEYAARAGAGTKYPWGEQIGRGNAACAGCGSTWDGRQTAPVGSFPANAFGLHEMLGNVWEWAQDCYVNDYDSAPSDGAFVDRPNCSSRVMRGGSWDSDPRLLRTGYRNRAGPRLRSGNLGFRVARTLAP